MSNTYSFRTIIDRDEDGAYYGSVPALAGCHTWGWSSIEETRRQLREAIDLYLRSLIEDGESIPTEHSFESIELITMDLAHA